MSADDGLAILDQIGRYSYAWDGKDSDAYAALFTEDAVFEVFTRGDEPVIHNAGREAIRRWARATHSGEEPGLRHHPPDEQTRHNQSGTVFEELGEDSARTRTMLLSARQAPGDVIPIPSTTGVYRDEWRRTDEGWRIVRRVADMDRPAPDAARG